MDRRNVLYFEAPSVRELYENMQRWQEAEDKRLLSVSIQLDGNKYCCIALSNPTEVVIAGVGTYNGALKVSVDNYMDFSS